MKILLASSEVHPYSKSGGLADMVGALGKTLANLNHEVGIVSPLYAGIRERFPDIQPLRYDLSLQMGSKLVDGKVWYLHGPAGEHLYFIENNHYFNRSNYYTEQGSDYPDNDERFVFFSKAVAFLAQNLPWHPEIIHVHDWQVGLVPLLVRHAAQQGNWKEAPATLFTIHNLAYQGGFPASSYSLTNLPDDHFRFEEVEFYGQMNCLKSGIVFADLLTTVSPSYAKEITTEEFGCGLDPVLRIRRNELLGILNGVDYAEWNTTHNSALPAPYTVNDLRGKAINKAFVQQELGLPVRSESPLFGNVSRLAEQKGVDICLEALDALLAADIQFALLGNGQPEFEAAFQALATRYPEKVAVRIGYNHALAHRIEAGADFFLMPSRFEPCGLNQMYSLRYGTIPIVRATGGLDDTIIDDTEDDLRANGLKFHEYSALALIQAMRKALRIHADTPLLLRYRQNGMVADFSWNQTAGEYIRAYEDAKTRAQKRT